MVKSKRRGPQKVSKTTRVSRRKAKKVFKKGENINMLGLKFVEEFNEMNYLYCV